MTGANGMSGSVIKGYSMRWPQWVLFLSTTIIKPLPLLRLWGPPIMSLLSLDAVPLCRRAVTGLLGHRQIFNMRIWPNLLWSFALRLGTRVISALCRASTPGFRTIKPWLWPSTRVAAPTQILFHLLLWRYKLRRSRLPLRLFINARWCCFFESIRCVGVHCTAVLMDLRSTWSTNIRGISSSLDRYRYRVMMEGQDDGHS